MPCKILVSNKSGVELGEIITVQGVDHEFSSTEVMSVFLSDGGVYDEWSRLFSLVIVTDKSEIELSYLKDIITPVGFDGELYAKNKYYFIQPDKESDLYNQLLTSGEVSAPFSLVSQYLGVR